MQKCSKIYFVGFRILGGMGRHEKLCKGVEFADQKLKKEVQEAIEKNSIK